MAETRRIWDSAPPPRRGGSRWRACVVDDDDAVLGSLKFVLEAAGFDVRGFAGGVELLSSPSMGTADCFVLDHKPRGADGLHLARRLRSLGFGAPIVLTTGFRCSALATFASAIAHLISTPRVDEEVIERLLRMIEETRRRDLRNIT